MAVLGRILILSCFVGLVVSECGQNSFKSDAGDKINAAFKSSHRKGVDYSKIEVEWQPFWMVEDAQCINEGELFLEMNHDGGEDGWVKVDGNMKSSGAQGKFKWTVDVAPCKDHYFRVWVSGEGKFLIIFLTVGEGYPYISSSDQLIDLKCHAYWR